MTVLHWKEILPKHQVEKGVKCNVGGQSRGANPPGERRVMLAGYEKPPRG